MHRISTSTAAATKVMRFGGIIQGNRAPQKRRQCSPFALAQYFSATPRRDDGPLVDRKIVNYFDILGINRSFSIQLDEVKSRYRDLMKFYHPDRLASAPPDERVRKAQMASDVTRAYDAVSSPLSRALHLLDLLDSPIGESDNSIVDSAFLIEIMEARENVDDASTDAEFKALLYPCRKKQAEICENIASAFENGDTTRAKVLTAKLQYWNRVEKKIKDNVYVA